MRHNLLSLALVSGAMLGIVGVAYAADAIKVELKDFKFTSDGNPDQVGFNEGDGKIFFYTPGSATTEMKVPADGTYTLTVEASCDEALDEKAKMSIKIGETEVEKSYELKSTEKKEYTFTVKLKKGDPKLEFKFLNDAYEEGKYDRNLYIHAVKFEAKAK